MSCMSTHRMLQPACFFHFFIVFFKYYVIHPERLFPDFFDQSICLDQIPTNSKGAPLKDWYMILMLVVMVMMMMMNTSYLIQLLIKLPHQIHALGIICIQKMLYLKRNALYLATSWLIFWKHWMDLRVAGKGVGEIWSTRRHTLEHVWWYLGHVMLYILVVDGHHSQCVKN